MKYGTKFFRVRDFKIGRRVLFSAGDLLLKVDTEIFRFFSIYVASPQSQEQQKDRKGACEYSWNFLNPIYKDQVGRLIHSSKYNIIW